jgi:nitrous oxide reductase
MVFRRIEEGVKMSSLDEIEKVFDEVKNLVMEKNKQYGDSVLDPVRVFSKAPVNEQIMVRLDDKLSRLARGNDSIESDEDIFKDIMGYCAFALIALRRRKENSGS